MIKENELRIGNWVWYKNDMYSDRPNKIRENWFQVKYIGDTIGLDIGFEATQRFEKKPLWSPEIKELKPIRLTPEILESFGFEKGYFDGEVFLTLELKQRLYIAYQDGDAACCSIFQDKKIIDLAAGRVKHLHQLQNLYFALTGEELEVKL